MNLLFEVPIGITVQCISIGTYNRITTLIHSYCQKRIKISGVIINKLEEKYSLESTDPRESEIREAGLHTP